VFSQERPRSEQAQYGGVFGAFVDVILEMAETGKEM